MINNSQSVKTWKLFLSVGLVYLSLVVNADVQKQDPPFDEQDMANLKIYTGQAYFINNILRDRVSLSALQSTVDFSKAPTCSAMLKNKVAYVNEVYLSPLTAMRPEDFRFYYFVKDALIHRGASGGSQLFRGANSCNFLMRPSSTDPKTLVPVDFHLERGFMSTSVNEGVAQRFTLPPNYMPEEGEKDKKMGCLMKINAVSGKTIAQATGNYNGEEEVLLAPGSLFKVKSFMMDGEQRVFELDEIPRESAEYNSMVAKFEKSKFDELSREFYSQQTTSSQSSNELFVKDAEKSCIEAYRFLTPKPEVREKLKKTKPIYDLTNRTLNPKDYLVEEEGG